MKTANASRSSANSGIPFWITAIVIAWAGIIFCATKLSRKPFQTTTSTETTPQKVGWTCKVDGKECETTVYRSSGNEKTGDPIKVVIQLNNADHKTLVLEGRTHFNWKETFGPVKADGKTIGDFTMIDTGNGLKYEGKIQIQDTKIPFTLAF